MLEYENEEIIPSYLSLSFMGQAYALKEQLEGLEGTLKTLAAKLALGTVVPTGDVDVPPAPPPEDDEVVKFKKEFADKNFTKDLLEQGRKYLIALKGSHAAESLIAEFESMVHDIDEALKPTKQTQEPIHQEPIHQEPIRQEPKTEPAPSESAAVKATEAAPTLAEQLAAAKLKETGQAQQQQAPPQQQAAHNSQQRSSLKICIWSIEAWTL